MGLSFDVRRNQAIVAQALASALPPPSPIAPSDIPHFVPTCEKVKAWWDHPAKVKMLCGGNRAGKSITGVAYVCHIARTRPGSLSWACALNFDMCGILFDLMRKYFHPSEIDYINWASRGKGIPHSVIWKNESKTVFKSMDAGFRKFEGAEVDGVILLDEECKEKRIYTSCVARTTGTPGQVILTMTPLMGKTWAYHDIFQKADGEKIYAETLTLYDNTTLARDDIDFIINFYSEEETPYRVYGEWGLVTGRVYRSFSEATHVIPYNQHIIDHLKVIIRSIDFGRWKAVTWIGIDENETAFVIGEWKYDECTMDTMAEEIWAMDEQLKVAGRIDDTVTDHAFQERFELSNSGIDCTPADKAVSLGIEICRRRIRNAAGTISVFVFDTCPKLTAELELYTQDDFGKPLKGQDDHLTDTFRYNLVDLDEYCTMKYGQSPGIESAAPSVFGGGR